MTKSADQLAAEVDENFKKIEAILGTEEYRNKTANDLVRIFTQPSSLKSKYFRLTKVVDNVMANVKPYSACKNECSHCCYTAVPIYEHEAKVISEFIKQPYAKVASLPLTQMTVNQAEIRLRELEANSFKYARVPCTFLKEGKCSIYEVRPMPCRFQYNISNDSSVCDMFADAGRDVPYFKGGPISDAVDILLQDQGTADIREFFSK